MTTFVVGHINWSENELRLEKIEAQSWQTAVSVHSKFPWKDEAQGDQPDMSDPEQFKQTCFDCDCMMNWLEVQS